jgi:CubicO group peptidase (beta-lactamase class C family)
MFATIATMILVDQGKIDLDEPLTTYLPGFTMISPEYGDITVRMLLNHSSGLPGGDMRNVASSEPYAGFAAQVMEGLKYQRLKHIPGYMSVYCNDGFTMLENLITAVTGKSFPAFVQQEILTPLGMANTSYPTARFSDGSYAKAHAGDTPLDFIAFNMYATGGLFSTAEDISRLAMMLMNNGVYGSRRILSERSVTAMGQDQTLGSFNPLPSNDWRFGLGWDSVAQSGLSAVGVKGWQKGGDVSGLYGSTFIVAPDEKMAVTVIGASNAIGSAAAAKVAERVLLAALTERGGACGHAGTARQDHPPAGGHTGT